jgi:hypothetical protein
VTENVNNETAMDLIKKRPTDWAGVQAMNYGEGCHPDNERLRKAAWGTKKKK